MHTYIFTVVWIPRLSGLNLGYVADVLVVVVSDVLVVAVSDVLVVVVSISEMVFHAYYWN